MKRVYTIIVCLLSVCNPGTTLPAVHADLQAIIDQEKHLNDSIHVTGLSSLTALLQDQTSKDQVLTLVRNVLHILSVSYLTEHAQELQQNKTLLAQTLEKGVSDLQWVQDNQWRIQAVLGSIDNLITLAHNTIITVERRAQKPDWMAWQTSARDLYTYFKEHQQTLKSAARPEDQATPLPADIVPLVGLMDHHDIDILVNQFNALDAHDAAASQNLARIFDQLSAAVSDRITKLLDIPASVIDHTRIYLTEAPAPHALLVTSLDALMGSFSLPNPMSTQDTLNNAAQAQDLLAAIRDSIGLVRTIFNLIQEHLQHNPLADITRLWTPLAGPAPRPSLSAVVKKGTRLRPTSFDTPYFAK